jgi:hypothetical protein
MIGLPSQPRRLSRLPISILAQISLGMRKRAKSLFHQARRLFLQARRWPRSDILRPHFKKSLPESGTLLPLPRLTMILYRLFVLLFWAMGVVHAITTVKPTNLNGTVAGTGAKNINKGKKGPSNVGHAHRGGNATLGASSHPKHKSVKNQARDLFTRQELECPPGFPGTLVYITCQLGMTDERLRALPGSALL